MGSIASQGAMGAVSPVASSPQATSTVASMPWRASASDGAFPWAGALLLLILVVAAVAAKAFARRRAGGPAFAALRWLTAAPVTGAEGVPALTLEATLRLDTHTQLHVVRWSGRRVMVATSAGAAPVVIDRASDSDADWEPRS